MVKMVHYIKELARFVIHPDAVPSGEEEFDFGMESSTCWHLSGRSPSIE